MSSVAETEGRRPRNALADLFLGSLANYAFPVVALVTSPILARVLGPAGRGELAALLTPLAFADAIASVGAPLAASYFISRGVDERAVRRAGVVVVTAAGAVTVLVLLATSGALLADYPELRLVLVLLAPSVLLGGYINLYRGIRTGQQAYGHLNANLWAGALSRLLAILVLAGIGAMTATSVAVASIVTGLLAGLALHRRRRGPAGEPLRLRPFASYAVRGWYGTLSSSITARLDQLLLITVVPAAALGNYAAAVTIAEAPGFVSAVVQRLLLVRSAGGSEADLAGSLRGMRLAVGFNLAVLAGVLALADVVVAVLFGPEFTEAATLLRILVVGTAVWGVSQAATGLLLGAGRPGASSTADVVAGVVTVLGVYPAVLVAGTRGAAVLAVLAYVLSGLVKLVVLRRALGTSWSELLLTRPSDLAHLAGLLRRLVRR